MIVRDRWCRYQLSYRASRLVDLAWEPRYAEDPAFPFVDVLLRVPPSGARAAQARCRQSGYAETAL